MIVLTSKICLIFSELLGKGEQDTLVYNNNFMFTIFF